MLHSSLTLQEQVNDVYEMAKAEKREHLELELNRLTRRHYECCRPYNSILSARGYSPEDTKSLEDIPFLPVRLFKTNKLSSVVDEDIIKVLTSSGTTGQQVSRIYLDKETALLQSSALIRIMQNFLGKKRLPMLVIDHASVIKDRNSFSARGAGIRGMANFGADLTYVLRDEDMSLDFEVLEAFLKKHKGSPILIFGFTFMVWEYFVQPLLNAGKSPDLSQAILIHSGGWKKLIEKAVSNETFKATLKQAARIERVHNFYGMVEQVGSVFVECNHGNLHTPAHADILIRSEKDWTVLPPGDEGLIQVLSALPHSYPGHSLLTEDRGILLGEDDCTCGLKGKYFKVLGRIAQAEARGCSDTHDRTEAA
ncbi:hypothetical protein PQU94_00875 [Asticcacaulis sp. DXS10W]|uniref:Acyl-protein synthetase LuxE domain-containing protein n=1 Tax=Asticcacaulis currens TaxID=2984210 RepID=A0ABT5I9H0_9CAUL|nr:hypothetical protein [Asticcacaulis currens]MDC7692825.1 hypothetical protein [Asticcacaulis currens]